MKVTILVGMIVSCAVSLSAPLWAQDRTLTAAQILGSVDGVMNAAKDQALSVRLVLVDEKGKEEIREMQMLQKGIDKRIAKFLSPASQKGIAFLSLPDDVMYLYMPAFGKARRIASHVKNSKFAGTDFSYEDMEAKRYSDRYSPELLRTEGDAYVLQLVPNEGLKTDYSKLIVWARRDNFYPSKIELYDKGDKLYKTMVSEQIEKVQGYWISKSYEMKDVKANHTTRIVVLNAKFDAGVSDDVFTERYLSR